MLRTSSRCSSKYYLFFILIPFSREHHAFKGINSHHYCKDFKTVESILLITLTSWTDRTPFLYTILRCLPTEYFTRYIRYDALSQPIRVNSFRDFSNPRWFHISLYTIIYRVKTLFCYIRGGMYFINYTQFMYYPERFLLVNQLSHLSLTQTSNWVCLWLSLTSAKKHTLNTVLTPYNTLLLQTWSCKRGLIKFSARIGPY